MAASYFSGFGEILTKLSSSMAGLMFVFAMFRQYMPECIFKQLDSLAQKIMDYFDTNVQIIFPEFTAEGKYKRSDLYLAIELYLSSVASAHAKRLKADMSKKSKNPVLSMDDKEEVKDEFLGVQVKWISNKKESKGTSISLYKNNEPDETRFYKLVFPRSHRDTFTTSYIQHLMEKAKQISAKNRKRKLYTNTGEEWCPWRSVIFEHPASFENLAMDPVKKQEIIDDLKTFSSSKDYYSKIGKAWKRGYLLYGPPGTGKSTMIACIANYLGYDVYDLELTAVKSNTQLREVLIETSSKSVLVIEDIDCSLDLSGRRKKKKKKKNEGKKKKGEDDEDEDEESSKVTLSGLLNSIDGLWSGCGSEKIIIFTTNHLEDLDPALIRRGRMDKHIEMSYCEFEAFKILAKNYLDIDSHYLFDDVRKLLEEVNMSPADVAENLIPKSSKDNADSCLRNLIEALRLAKDEAAVAKGGQEEADDEAELKKLKVIGRMKQKLLKKFKKVNDVGD